MLRASTITLTLMASILLLSIQAAPMSGLEQSANKAYAKMHEAGRRARQEHNNSVSPESRYNIPYSFYGQFVDGGFPPPKEGWQDWFRETGKYEEVYSNGYHALQRFGADPEMTQNLLDKYGNDAVGHCLLMDIEEYQLAVARHLLDKAAKDRTRAH